MNEALRHRGPDDAGVHVDARRGVAIAARRLSIIDVEGGHQPVSNETGTVWAVLNGEIYNHPELQEELRRDGHTLSSRVDTEVLVHLYEQHGERLVDRLEGMYAFAVWDEQRGRLLLARDRFGEKPLFYAERDGVLTFASELDPLLAGSGIALELDGDAVDDFFVFGYVPGPRTIARGVRQLPPGCMLLWDAGSGRLEERHYWSPPRRAASADAAFPELVTQTRELLARSVRSRMISDVPLGVFLSGGVDSTLIAALAAETSTKRVSTFTVGYDVGSVNETEAARATAAELGTDHHELELPEAEVAARVPSLLARVDQPLADQAFVSLHAIAEVARREVTVAVGGEGADELFGGYPRYRWLQRAARLHRVLPAALGARGAKLVVATPLAGRTRRLADVLAPASDLDRHLDWVTFNRRAPREALYGERMQATDRERLTADLAPHVDGVDHRAETVASRYMRLDQAHWLPDDVLMKADRAGMLVSLEIRTPYLNREVAEFAASVPTATHLRGGGKALLRAALREVAPRAAGRRPKTAFRVPVEDWLRGPLAGVLEERLNRGALVEEGWFDRRAVAALAAEHRSGAHDHGTVLWPLLALSLWLDARR